jgi:sugar phosphate isomerase/epimerase
MRISIASYAFHGLVKAGMMDVFGYLETVKYRYGLDAADIWNGMLPTTEEGFLRKVREALDERALTLANLCVDGAHIWEDDPAQRERNYQNALAALRAAEILGAKTVRIDAGSRAAVFTNEQFDLVAKRFKEYCRFGAERGFRVGPENHWGPEKVPAIMKAIHDAVDDPVFGVLLHLGGWTGDDPAIAAAEGDAMAAPWAMHTHMSWDIIANELVEKMTLLRDAGYQGYWGVEHHSGRDEYSETAVMMAQVRDQLEKWRVAGS